MEREAAANASKGLSTRIPFLKRALCGEKAPEGESVQTSPRALNPDACEGEHFSLYANSMLSVFRLRAFWDDLARFNSASASRGLQALPVEKPFQKKIRFRVTPCEIAYLGDLRICRVLGDESGLQLAGGGTFNAAIYNVFLRKDQKYYSWNFVLSHELEHALHHSIWGLSGFPALLLPSDCAEYLAMLRTLIDLGQAPQLLAWKNEFMQVRLAEGGQDGWESIPHNEAANYFVKRLVGRYSMGRQDVAMAIAWTFREELLEGYGQDIGLQSAEQFVRMRNAAIGEYGEAYRGLFGMELDDLKEAVSRLTL